MLEQGLELPGVSVCKAHCYFPFPEAPCAFISPMPGSPHARGISFIHSQCSQDSLLGWALLPNTHLPSGERRAKDHPHTLYWHWEAEVHHALHGDTKAHRPQHSAPIWK